MMRAALLQPRLHAGAHAALRPEEEIGHVAAPQVRLVQHLARRVDQAETVAAQVRKAHHRYGPGLLGEDQRRRVVQAALAEHAVHQERLSVRAGHGPVALARMAHQDGLARQVHHVHLAEVGAAAQADHRGHEHGAGGVALGGVAVALGHEVGRGQEGQVDEAPVRAQLVKVKGVARIAAGLQPGADAQVHARRLGVPLRRHARVHVEALPVQRHLPRDLLFVRFGAQALHRADGIVHEFRSQYAVNRHVVRHHVAHAGQAADHADAHAPHGLHRARRRAEVPDEGGELPVFAAAREEGAGDARAQKAVGVVL